MKKLNLKEVLKKSKLSRHTFEYYKGAGLLPKAEIRAGEKGKGRYGFYDPSILGIIEKIKALKKQGLTLKEAREAMNKEITLKAKEIIGHYGTDWPMKDRFSPVDLMAFTEMGIPKKQALELKKYWISLRPEFEKDLIEKVGPSSDEDVERYVLLYCLGEGRANAFFYQKYLDDLIEEYEVARSKAERVVIGKLVRKGVSRIFLHYVTLADYKARLAEIDGEYLGRASAQWEKIRDDIFMTSIAAFKKK